MINSYAGPKVLLSEELPKEQDWSLCRSPSRAKRRYRQGHKQHMRWVETPYAIMAGKTAIVTAAMYGRLTSKIEADIMKAMMVEGSATTYSHFNEEQSKFTVDMIKDSVRKLGLDKVELDPFEFSIFEPMDIKLNPRRYWG